MGADLTAACRGTWRTVAASVAGTSHASTGQPCADAWAMREVPLAGGGSLLCVCVADGAGSSACAPEGARLACDTVADLAAEWASEHGGLDEFSPESAREWVERVRSRIGAAAEVHERKRRDYAATLLVALVDETCAVFFQVGDGAIVYREADGPVTAALWPQNGEYANTTWFVTDDEAADRVELARAPGVCELALLTDGLQSLALRFGTRSVHAPFFEPMFERLRAAPPPLPDDAAAAEPAACLDTQLAAFLGSERVNARTDDDKTLVLAVRVSGEP